MSVGFGIVGSGLMAGVYANALKDDTMNTRFVGVDPVVDPAAQLRARYRVTLADAFQVAAAISEGCDALLTNDLGLRRVNELRVIVLDELVANGTNDT